MPINFQIISSGLNKEGSQVHLNISKVNSHKPIVCTIMKLMHASTAKVRRADEPAFAGFIPHAHFAIVVSLSTHSLLEFINQAGERTLPITFHLGKSLTPLFEDNSPLLKYNSRIEEQKKILTRARFMMQSSKDISTIKMHFKDACSKASRQKQRGTYTCAKYVQPRLFIYRVDS